MLCRLLPGIKNRMTEDNGRPRLIVVTGCNGVGKSTVAQALCDRLPAVRFHYPPAFLQFRAEAGLDGVVAPLPRLLYYVGATLHLSDLVQQQLVRGHAVCDRYLESPVSLLLAESAMAEPEVEAAVAPFLPFLRVPDITLLLTADYETACRRIRSRIPVRASRTEQKVLESRTFFERRESGLRQWAAKLGPVVEMSTTGLALEEMCDAAWSRLLPRLSHR